MRDGSTQQSPTRRLTILYICALSSVALLAIIGQVVIQLALQQQSGDAAVINIAGRQRMLSQKISKDALILQMPGIAPDVLQQRSKELRQSTDLWESSHLALQHGSASMGLSGNNSPEVKRLFDTIEPGFETMLTAAKSILTTLDQPQSRTNKISTAIAPDVQTILAQESGFLVGMNTIVSQYQTEAEAHVSALKTTEFTLLGVTLVVLLLEGSFVFRPTSRKLDQTIKDIMDLKKSIAEQKSQLEDGIQQILQTHVEAANGNFNTRAPLTKDHVLWQIAYSLNNLLNRIQRLSQVENDFQRVKVDASHMVGSLQSQAGQLKRELQQVQAETALLVDILREARTKSQPIWAPTSRTVLDPLCRELVGNYLQPSLKAGKSNE